MKTIYKSNLDLYLELVERARAAIGWRLHGNMLHLAHGNPAIFFANCSRAQSFCEAFELPCLFCPDGRRLSESRIADMVERLFDPASFASFGKQYHKYYQTMIEFLEANGLGHNLSRAVDREAGTTAA